MSDEQSAESDALAQTLRTLAEDRATLALAAQNHLIAQRDYMGQGLEFLVNPWAETLRTLADALCPIPPAIDPVVATSTSGEPIDLLAALQRSIDAAKASENRTPPGQFSQEFIDRITEQHHD